MKKIGKKAAKRYVIALPAGGGAVLLHCYPGDGIGLKDLQKIVDGPIECVAAALSEWWSGEEGVGLCLIVNEEGKLRGLPVNENATALSVLLYDQLVGNAVLVGIRGEEMIGLEEKAAERIVERWDLDGGE